MNRVMWVIVLAIGILLGLIAFYTSKFFTYSIWLLVLFVVCGLVRSKSKRMKNCILTGVSLWVVGLTVDEGMVGTIQWFRWNIPMDWKSFGIGCVLIVFVGLPASFISGRLSYFHLKWSILTGVGLATVIMVVGILMKVTVIP